jgi:serine/threonine protein kinase
MGLRAGRYEILRSIASGGMAKVHLGRAVGAGGFERQVAIKTMHPHLSEQADFVTMFLDEARLSARVHHPNVVATLDVQQDDEGIFLVMEFVDGFALHAILGASREEGRALPFELSLRIFLDLLAGLHAAHELTDGDGAPLEVIHRDVSPHNILVGVDGGARITDFGIARAAVRLSSTREGHLKGKLRYMAPEQLGGGKLDRRADLHAAGAVLWEMLAGRCLVNGEDEGACLMEIGRPDKASPRTHNPDVPEPIAAACLRALRLDPEERYATAAAFAEAVEGAAAEAGVVVASPREVSTFVRALKARDLSPASPASSSGERTATAAVHGPQMVTTQTAAVELTRAEPRPRRIPPIVAMAILAAGAAVLAMVMLGRSSASVQATASTATVAVIPAAPMTAAPAAIRADVDKAPQVAAPAPSPTPPSVAPPSTSPPPKLRPSPGKPGAPFRPREL